MRKFILLFLTILINAHLGLSNDGYLGIAIKSIELEGQDGLRITDVFDDGAALVAGLKENDFITQVNDFYVAKPMDLKNIIKDKQWGDIVDISYIRNGEIFEQSVILGHQKRIRTYNIVKTDIVNNVETWHFDDNTSIILVNDAANTITKTINGEETSLDLTQYTDFNQLPQNFLDVNDKLFIIQKTKEDQENKNSTANNVVVIKEVIEKQVTTQVENDIEFSEFKLFPNPSNGEFDVVLKSNELSKDLKYFVYDVQGRNLLQGNADGSSGELAEHIKLDNLAAGTYLFLIRDGEKSVRQKFVVE